MINSVNQNVVAKQLRELPYLKKPRLLELWGELFGTNPPEHFRKDALIRFLSYRLQEQALGGLNPSARRKLRELARKLEANSSADLTSPVRAKPGTRLVRQWQDQTHIVTIEPRGYEYKGTRYDSLSEIARTITGTRWSGPLFFGLRKSAARQAQQEKV